MMTKQGHTGETLSTTHGQEGKLKFVASNGFAKAAITKFTVKRTKFVWEAGGGFVKVFNLSSHCSQS